MFFLKKIILSSVLQVGHWTIMG